MRTASVAPRADTLGDSIFKGRTLDGCNAGLLSQLWILNNIACNPRALVPDQLNDAKQARNTALVSENGEGPFEHICLAHYVLPPPSLIIRPELSELEHYLVLE